MSYVPGRHQVTAQAEAAMAALEARRPGAAALLSHDPISELETWEDVDIERIESIPDQEGCEVAGSYRRTPQGAVLTIVRALSAARERFTVLHELGHYIQRTNRVTARSLAAEPSRDRQLEERACDEFAARILLPDETVSLHIAASGSTAASVVRLMRSVSASRSACCVSAARRIPAPGHVLLLDEHGVLLFAASVGLPRPARLSDQSRCTLIHQALGGRTARVADARVSYRDGDWLGEALHGDASWHRTYLVAVLTADHVPWGGLSVRPADATTPIARTWLCANLACGNQFPAHHRCENCGKPRCPDCGHCSCAERRPPRTCTRCFLELSQVEMSQGLDEHVECP